LKTWVGLTLLTFFTTTFRTYCFSKALQGLDAIQTALSNYLITFFGVPIAVIWLGERLTAQGWWAACSCWRAHC
jgi:drug/metabolite transporter (DMT)-like permease